MIIDQQLFAQQQWNHLKLSDINKEGKKEAPR